MHIKQNIALKKNYAEVIIQNGGTGLYIYVH